MRFAHVLRRLASRVAVQVAAAGVGTLVASRECDCLTLELDAATARALASALEAAEDEVQPRSSYLAEALRQPDKIADRAAMIRYYLDDVARLKATATTVPPLQQDVVRLATWNLNMLLGPDGKSTISPHDVYAVIQAWDADVLVLQEVPIDLLDVIW